jgi:hypothetical protein
VSIRNERGPLEAYTVDPDLEVQAGAVRFRTARGLSVLPVAAQVFLKRRLPPAAPDDDAARSEEDLYRLLYADLLKTSPPAFYQTLPLPPPAADGTLTGVDVIADAVDRSLWIALLTRSEKEDREQARAALAGRTLTVGILPLLPATGLRVPAGSTSVEEALQRTEWRLAVARGRAVTYDPVNVTATGDPLAEPTLIEITLPAPLPAWEPAFEPGEEGTGDLPPSLADTDLGGRVVAWLRLRLPPGEQGAARIAWLDINATLATQRVVVEGEPVGTGSGEPDQQFALANRPVIPEELKVWVDGVQWHPIDDLLAADPEVPVGDPCRPLYASDAARPDARNIFVLDREAATLTFGNGAHGARPRGPVVATYAFGGGRAGNVGIGAINRSPQLPGGFKVENPLRTWGGADAEDVPSAERRIPRQVRHRDRLVSKEDFLEIARNTPGIDLGRVEVLPLYDPITRQEGVPGLVTVLVVPAFDPQAPDAPAPDRFFLDAVCRHLQPRRLITTELHIRGPEYRDIVVSAGVAVVGGLALAPVLEAVRRELRRFLSPLRGGRDGRGWPLDTPVLERELEAIVARVEGVRLVQQIFLGAVAGGVVSKTTAIPLSNLQLPRLVAVEAGLEIAAPIAPEVAGGGPETPIPVVPKGC